MVNVEELVPMEELIPLIKEVLSTGQSVQISPKGTSMLPMIRQGIDSVVLSPIHDRLKKYDLPLYQRDNGQYVLHRIVGVEDTYVCVGDNQFAMESNLREDQMIAVVTAFFRGNKKHSTSEVGYRAYCRIWHHSRSLRRFWFRGKRWIYRHFFSKHPRS